jgi:hypothetical protein
MVYTIHNMLLNLSRGKMPPDSLPFTTGAGFWTS